MITRIAWFSPYFFSQYLVLSLWCLMEFMWVKTEHFNIKKSIPTCINFEPFFLKFLIITYSENVKFFIFPVHTRFIIFLSINFRTLLVLSPYPSYYIMLRKKKKKSNLFKRYTKKIGLYS